MTVSQHASMTDELEALIAKAREWDRTATPAACQTLYFIRSDLTKIAYNPERGL